MQNILILRNILKFRRMPTVQKKLVFPVEEILKDFTED